MVFGFWASETGWRGGFRHCDGVFLGAFQVKPNPPLSVPARFAAPEILYAGTAEPLLALRFNESPGRPYRVASSPNLATWAMFQSTVLDLQVIFIFRVLFDPAGPSRLYLAKRSEDAAQSGLRWRYLGFRD